MDNPSGFKYSGEIYYVKFANVIGLFEEYEKYMIVSFVCAQLKKYCVDDDGRKRHEVGIEPKYFKYGCIPGANNRRKTLTAAEEADYNARLVEFTQKPLYPSRYKYVDVSNFPLIIYRSTSLKNSLLKRSSLSRLKVLAMTACCTLSTLP